MRKNRRRRRRLSSAAVALSLAAMAAPAWAQEQSPAEREGPQVQAEGQDVSGGLEAEPSEEYAASEHLLGDLGGFRADLAGRGISIDPVLTLDFASNFRHGNDTNGSAFLHILNLYVTVETEPLFGFEGGTFYADLLTQNGQSPSDEAGDYQLISEYDYGGRTQVSEIWYEQQLLNETLRVRVGKIDANAEFCYAENSFDFSNGGLNYAFPISQFNFMPTAPDPSFGGTAFVTLAGLPNGVEPYVGVGVFDGALQEGRETGRLGPETLYDDPSDLYFVGEVGSRFDLDGKPWVVKLGAFHHTGTFDEFDGGSDNGNTGFYALLDAKLWKEVPADEEDEQGLGTFLVYDTADSDVTEVDHHFAGGLAWTGALPGRDADVFGVGASYAHFSGGAGFLDTGELSVETFYKLAVTEFLSVKADLQYIKDPGGAGLEDALVGLVRVQVAF
jgi:porin